MHFASSASALTLLALSLKASADAPTNVAAEIACPYKPQWGPCQGEVPDGIDCASMDVPKDWTDESKARGHITLRLVRRRARVPDEDVHSAPAIIINPGGPGSSGINAVLEGSYYQDVAGGNFSIIGYDPRGVGLNMPYQCKPQRALVSQPGVDYDREGFFDDAFKYYSDFADACDEEWGGSGSVSKIGRLISTTQTARDIYAISRKVGDGRLRYWGFSYGTLLGATIAKLFPDEIEGMIIDGNINPNDYYNTNNPPDEESDDIDEGVENFFNQCALAPAGTGDNQCAWETPADEQRTGASLLAKFAAWVGDDPEAENRGRDGSLPEAQRLSVGQSYVVRDTLFGVLKSPDSFSQAARVLQFWYHDKNEIPQSAPDSVNDVDTSKDARIKRRQNAGSFDPNEATAEQNAAPNAINGITCVDSRYHASPLNGGVYEGIYGLYNGRTKYGGDTSIGLVYTCMPWKTLPKEVFPPPDPFPAGGISTSPRQVVVIQTPFDPVTPLASGKAAAAALSGFLVQYNGTGHCSSADPSNDLMMAIRAYWQNGTIPEATYTSDQPNAFIDDPDVPPPMASPPPVDNGDGSGENSTTDPDMMRKRGLVDLSGLQPPQQPRVLPDYSYLFPSQNMDRRQEASMEEDDTTPPETVGPDQRTATEESCDTFTTMPASTGWQDQPTMTVKPKHPHHTDGPKKYGHREPEKGSEREH